MCQDDGDERIVLSLNLIKGEGWLSKEMDGQAEIQEGRSIILKMEYKTNLKYINNPTYKIVCALCKDYERREKAIRENKLNSEDLSLYKYLNDTIDKSIAEVSICAETWRVQLRKDIGNGVGHRRTQLYDMPISLYKECKRLFINAIARNLRLYPVPDEDEPTRRKNRLTVNGETKSISEWSRELYVAPGTIYSWIYKKGQAYAEQRLKEIYNTLKLHQMRRN